MLAVYSALGRPAAAEVEHNDSAVVAKVEHSDSVVAADVVK